MCGPLFSISLLLKWPTMSKLNHPGLTNCNVFSAGMVAPSSSPAHEANHNFVNVEFDDGDSGKIHVDDIRLLPPEFPVLGQFLCLVM